MPSETLIITFGSNTAHLPSSPQFIIIECSDHFVPSETLIVNLGRIQPTCQLSSILRENPAGAGGSLVFLYLGVIIFVSSVTMIVTFSTEFGYIGYFIEVSLEK